MSRRQYCLLLVLCAACASNARRIPAPQACSATPPSNSAPFDSTQLATLVGQFRLEQVYGDRRDPQEPPIRTRFNLAIADSAERASAREKRLGHRPRDYQLVGRWYWSDTYGPQEAEFSGSVLTLGCRDCTDASPDYLHITSVSADGFWGTWINLQSGIGISLRKEEGYFCAYRERDAAAT